MTWNELAAIQRVTAQYLFNQKEPTYERPICGRAYYAAYALVTSCLPESTTFGRGWNNPQHANLPQYVDQIAGLPERDRRIIRRALRRLRQRREDADYRPGITIDRVAAKESMRDAAEIFRLLDRSR